MTDIRTIAASIRAAGAVGSDVRTTAASLPRLPILAYAALAQPFTIAARIGAQINPFAGRVFVPGFTPSEE